MNNLICDKKEKPLNHTILRVLIQFAFQLAEKEGLQPALVCLDITDLAILLF